jgi:lipopolysaccharide export system protein LptC
MDSYSRLVGVLKIGLPLLALVLLTSMFVVQTEDDFSGGIVFGEADLEQLGQGLRITEPVLTGTTREDDPFRFTAELVIPDAAPPARAEVRVLDGRIDFRGGPSVSLRAPEAAIDLETDVMLLSGRVTVESDDGYQLTADRMRIDLASGEAVAEGAVDGLGPMGAITSETLTITPAKDGSGRRVFSFGSGVRLVYRGDDDTDR